MVYIIDNSGGLWDSFIESFIPYRSAFKSAFKNILIH